MTGQPSQLLPDTEYLLERDKAALGTAITASNGGDVLVDPPAFGYPKDMHVELERRLHFEKDRNDKMNEVFKSPQSGWGDIQKFMGGVFDAYKKQNDSAVIKVPKNEQEAIAQMQQMRPVQVDPNEVANIRQMAVKLDQQMKAVDPRTSFWTDSRTKHIAEWLNREASPGTAGYMTSGEQPVEMGAVGRTAYVGWQGVEGIGSATTSLVHGLWDLGRQSISAMGGPDIGPSYPTNYIEGEDGQLVANGGKAPSIMDGIVMTWAYATNQNIEKHAAAAGRAQEWELANREGFAGIATSVSRLGGELIGMAPGFGAAGKVGEMTMGALTNRGLQALGTLRLTKGVTESARAVKIIKAMSNGIGTAAGMAGYEATTQGRVEGYGASYLHGLMMAPVLMTLGALGKKTEWFANNRLGMPGAASRAIAGAMEGIGFGAIESTIPDVLPSAWNFIRDPNQSTFDSYMKNMLAFAMVKMGSGHTTAADPAQMQIRRGIGRGQFAEKVARGEAKPEDIAAAPVPNEAALRELGEASRMAREGKTVQERSAAKKRQNELELQLDAEEFGQRPPGEKDVEAYKDFEQPGTPSPVVERTWPKREEIQAIKNLPPGPEKNQRTAAMLRRMEKTAPTKLAEGITKVADTFRQTKEKDVAAEQQLIEAEAVVQALMGSRKDTATSGDIRDQMVRRLKAEHGIDISQKLINEKEKPKQPKPPADEFGTPEEMEALSKASEMSVEELGAVAKQLGAKNVAELAKELGVTVDSNRGTSVLPVRDMARPEGAEPVPRVPREGDAGVAQDTPAAGRAAAPGERAPVRERLPAEGEAGEAAVRGVPGAGADAPRRLQPAAEGEVAVQGAPSGAAQEPAGLEARAGDTRSPAGERRGPQSLQQPPTRQVDPTPGTQQVRAADIVGEMEGRPGQKGLRIPFFSKRIGATEGDPVQTPFRSGHLSSRGALGVFKFFENLVRTGEGRDLAVKAHEWSHAMHRHMLGQGPRGGGKEFVQNAKLQMREIEQRPDGPAIYSEIKEMLKDYPGSSEMPRWQQLTEAHAEWHARNLLGEVGLDAKMPALSAYMRSWLAAPERASLRPQYGRIQEMLHRYNAQGSLGRLRQSRISGAAKPTETERATKPGLLRRAVTAINKSMLDDMAELKQSQEKWLAAVGRKPEDVSIDEDPARLFDTLRMVSNKTVEHFVNRGIRQPDGTMVPGLKSVMDAVEGRTEEFQDFVVAVRSMELYQKGKEVQLPPQDYVESVKQLSGRNPDFVEQLSNLKRWTDALVDYVVGAGNLSIEDGERIKKSYAVYVPFFRAIEGPAQHGQGRGVAERGTGLSRIKGSTYEIKDPFIALQQVARSMVGKAHQNQVMTALYKMSHGQEAGGMASVVGRANVPTDHPLARLLDAIEKKGAENMLDVDLQEDMAAVFQALKDADALNPMTITTFMQKVIPTGERNIIAYTPRLSDVEIESLVRQGANEGLLRDQNNKLQWMEVDTKVYEALMGIDKMPQLPEAMQPVMQWLQAPRDVVRFFATGVAPGFVAANLVRDALSAPIFDRAGKFRPFGGFVKLIRGAIEYHKNGNMRELYEELGVKTSSFWTEGRQRALIGEETSLWHKAKAMADRAQNWFSHPENYIRMAEFKDTYNAAKAAGKTEFQARMEALESGREITVNFARAGILARVLNQTIPYFNAGLQGQRKLWGQLIAGGADTKGDVNKARVQRGAILNGIANLTVPATLLWLLNKDEEWYQDLPDWRKVGYFNMKIGDEIVSVPKPFEAGTVFASLPEIMLDHLFGKNPASMKEAMKSVAGPYLEVGNVIPAFIKPLVEVGFNYNIFTNRPLTPEWIAKSSPPEEQATFYTTETARVMSRAIGGMLSPIEIEQLTGGYTAGAATKALRVLDEVAGLKDHPGLQMNPMQRFTSQQPHGQSSFVDQLYTLSKDLDQREGGEDFQDQSLKRQVDHAKSEISDLRKSYREGSITREEAERRSYEIARPIIERDQ